ncbi:inosine/xanthosine triphosphatase [Haloarchaeobius sp. HME9146]|uniref:inosine/xanthosine triphosphatase n=1 Tax=Haloarchaeobius sp. HME9146 TaxID=2978732 RepID=UPI0021C0B5B8|nr:inosine/xanthosine triphosphatase [Haloarchaeobius sp. HME9146]MCT9095768.1 inosine/xanthosine triphosphatase [Haloarchaeobius sp. HME9146]
MRVAIGSQNPVKVAATERALETLPGVAIEPVAVDSGVPEQPRGLDQTIMGAANRARRAYETGAFDLAVGIEGGVADLTPEPRTDDADAPEDLHLIMWAAVFDGNRVERAAGPSIRLPDGVASRVRDGEELGPVMNDEFDRDDVARSEGAVGVFTGGAIDRQDALENAVAGALGPFVTSHYRS